ANNANRGESSRFWKGSCLPGQGAAEQAACVWQIRAKRSWCRVTAVADRGVGGSELLINKASSVQACSKRLHHEAERKQMHDGMPARPCAINGHKWESTAIASPRQSIRCLSRQSRQIGNTAGRGLARCRKVTRREGADREALRLGLN